MEISFVITLLIVGAIREQLSRLSRWLQDARNQLSRAN